MDRIRRALLTALAFAALACVDTTNVVTQTPAQSPAPVETASPPIASLGPTIPARTAGPELTEVFCGVLSPNTIPSGAGSGTNVVELRPATSERTGSISSTRFGWTDRPAFGSYVCASLALGAPIGAFRSAVAPDDPAYIASVAPTGFRLPRTCRYVGLPKVPDDQTIVWAFDCGDTANRDARGALRAALTEQGWASCAVGLAREVWRKDTSRLSIAEASGSPDGSPTLTQRLVYDGGGGPTSAACE